MSDLEYLQRRLKAARERLAYWQGNPSFGRHAFRPWSSDGITRIMKIENAEIDIQSLKAEIQKLKSN